MEWFESWFDTPYYHILYKNHDFREAEDFITLLVNDLELPKGAKIIDLACGKGRHSIFLNKLGYDVLGLDLSQQSIEHDKQFENDTLHFDVHDMRQPIKITEKQDAVFNLFTSFGYFDNPEDDFAVFQSVSNSLKMGGYFVLDYMNQNYVRNTLVPTSTVEREAMTFNITKEIENNFIVKNIRFEDKGQNFHFFERVKLHTSETINAYAEKAGFERVKVWGNYGLEAFNEETSARCITLFKKIKD